MKRIGIICEYNPFHNGHIYHINKIKELFPDSSIVLVMSTNYTERGEISLLNKWDKTKIALDNNIDLVVELPFFYQTNSGDYFAKGAINILSYLNVDYLVFGTETDNTDLFYKLVDTQLNNPEYDLIVKSYLEEGLNYPTSMSKALFDILGETINTPNDLLALSYIKQIKLLNSNIIPIPIKRTNDYHSINTNNNICSATEIRDNLKNNIDISLKVPSLTNELIIRNDPYINYYKLLKYKIISEIDSLDKYLDVEEGIENRIKKYILKSNSLDELINNIKTKRYTYNRLKRMFLHIYTNLTKDIVPILNQITYIRVLGFNKEGKKIIKEVREEGYIPVITNYSDIDDFILNIELKETFLYNQIIEREDLNLIELKSIPIQK